MLVEGGILVGIFFFPQKFAGESISATFGPIGAIFREIGPIMIIDDIKIISLRLIIIR